MAALDTFLNSLVENAIKVLQITDGSLSSAPLDDPVVRECAAIAYSQACSYCSRKFAKQEFTEEYHSVRDKISLRQRPVVSVTSVSIDNLPLVLDVDYSVSRNKITLLKRLPASLADTFLSEAKDVVVTYVGGFDYANSDEDIFRALTLQTVTLYNRKTTLGIGTTTGRTSQGITGSSTIGGADDKGGLLDSVKIILDTFISFADVDYV